MSLSCRCTSPAIAATWRSLAPEQIYSTYLGPEDFRQAYEDYFELETQLAASGAVDVLAHTDVVKVHGDVPDASPRDLYEEVVAAAAASGTAVEVSSSGLHKPIAEIYPAPPMLEMFQAAGVGITLASDAHEPADCGRNVESLVAAAQSAGYGYHLVFDQRIAAETPLPVRPTTFMDDGEASP